MLPGIDVSNNNGGVDWAKVAGHGVKFAYLKATEGLSFTDANYRSNRAAANREGLAVGAYLFARPALGDPKAQARHFAAFAQVRSGDLVPMIDIEGQLRPSYLPFLVSLCRAVDKLTGSRCGVYLSPSDASELHTRLWAGLRRRPLWLASWRETLPAPPAPWKRVTVWQHSSTGTVPGVKGHCDLNWLVDPFRSLRVGA